MPNEETSLTGSTEIHNLSFARINVPVPYESKNVSDDTFVTWGRNNFYPNFIVDLYGQSAIHSAIVNQKTTYILGNGLRYVNQPVQNSPTGVKPPQEIDINVNASDTLDQFVSKIVKDFLIFNAFAVEVVFNIMGEPIEFHHVPFLKLRMNHLKNRFWYCENWTISRKYIKYDRYNPTNNLDTNSKIFMFDGFFPSIYNVYPQPEYYGTIKSIMSNIAIDEFILNNIKNQFSPSSILTFFNGNNITKDVKRNMVDDIDNRYKGENGNKFIVEFVPIDGKPSQVTQLSANDWDKAFLAAQESTINNIMVGHQVQSPQLFAIQTAGKLGNSAELETMYEIFKAKYITVKRNEIEGALNQMFKNFKLITDKIEFVDKPLFAQTMSDNTKLQVMTINEMRATLALPPLPDGDKLLTAIANPMLPKIHPAPPAVDTSGNLPEVLPSEQSEQTGNEKKKSGKKLTEDDFESIKHLGTHRSEFEVLGNHNENLKTHKFDKTSDIANYVISNDIKGITIEDLIKLLKKKGIDTDASELKDTLKELDDSGVVDVDIADDGILKITPNPQPEIPDTDRISVMYEYVKRPEASGDDLLPTSRSFCVKLITNDRLYTRADIQEMSAIFGYDIYQFCGGWWHDPETDTTDSQCRHKWNAVQVKKRKV